MKRFAILDFVLLGIMVFTGFFLIIRTFSQKGQKVLVQANGKNFEYSLSQNGIYSVQGILGPTTFEIKDGKVRIIDSPCPEKTCVHQNWSSPLVCLPNKVIISIESQGEFDAVSE